MGWLRDTLGRLGGGAPQAGKAAELLAQGSALVAEGRFEEASDQLERAVAAMRPGDGIAPDQLHYLLGRAQAGAGRLAPASMNFEAAVRARPDFAEALEEGARILTELESHEEAADSLQRLVQLQPTAAARLQLAQALRKCDRHAEAADVLQKLCAEDLRNIDARLVYHHVLLRLDRLEEGLEQIDRVLTMRKPDAALLVNRAVPLARLGRHDEALSCLGKALKLEPTHARALANRVSAYLGQLRVPEAIAAAEEALRVHPEDPDLHWRLGASLLLQGDWQRGWAEAEWRTRATGYEGTVPRLDRPRWQGESLAGRTIFLYAEQGFGDAIQFVRFVPEVARTAGTVLLLVWPEVEPLLAGMLPANCRIVPRGSELPPFDFECPLMSLPRVLGTTPSTVPAHVPYLQAPPAAVQSWRQRLAADRLNVGICWSGNPRHFSDRERSMTLAAMRTVAAEGCRFHSLQPQKRAGDEEVLAAWADAVDTGPELHDFTDTAALIQALDVVVTVDTSVAHLAGALGKPVWILLAHAPDWRWMLERADTPWYPTARLYRQPQRGDWAAVLKRVQADLAALARQR
jgi:tetratricopeptide (TPR) repeat protein